MTRSVLALIALFALTAFAPAPFPKPQRERNEIDMKSFQGTWDVVSMEIVRQGGRRQRLRDWGVDAKGTNGVRIEGDCWTFLPPTDDRSDFRISIDSSTKPALIDGFPLPGDDRAGITGLIRREGNKVTVLYYATHPDQRPKTFDNPPIGWAILTLKRQR
jgi:uncharacterized protein (TIGR03067 family)